MNRRDFLKPSLAAAVATAGSVFLGGSLLSVAAAPAERRKHYGKKIVVITGSPRKNGNSSTLADHFIRGAEEAGHEMVRFDAAFKEVHPCIACNKCGMNGECVFKDDFEFVRKHIVDAGMVVFATPMYYFGISAQIKAVIDRFYAVNGSIHVPKKAALLMTYADNNRRKEKAIIDHYEVLLDYLGWSDAGQIIAPGVWPVGAVNRTKYPELAYQLGKSV